jgi:Pectate lyase superfamily protein
MKRYACALLVFLLAVVLPAFGKPPIDPADHGALGDGKADDTGAIRAALAAAAEGTHIVQLQPGTYRITGELSVPHGVSLSGSAPRWEDSSSTIVVADKGFSAVRLGNFSNVRGLAFTYPNNRENDKPQEYPPTILIAGINPSVEQVRFDSAWIGIAPPPEGANTGQSLFRDITGFVHKTGIRLDGIKDIARIEDVHWFVGNSGGGFFRKERVGFEFGAVDGVIMSRCFMIGGKTFYHQLAKDGKGKAVHSLGHHVTQCWTEAVEYGFLIEGTCGLVLSDTQIYVSNPEGAGIAMRMPHLYYNSTISNTQVRCDGSQALGIDYSPTADHPRNHLMLSHCEIVEASTGVTLGENARRVWVTENHIRARDLGVAISEGADALIIRDNMIGAAKAIDDQSGPDAKKQVSGNMAL